MKILVPLYVFLFSFIRSYAFCDDANKTVCLTPACVKAAQGLLITVDLSANPCTDFYAFACGKFAKEHPIPDEYSSYSPGDQIQEQLLRNLRVLLTNNSASPSKAIIFVKMMFGACVDTNRTKAAKSDELRRSLKEIGDWPIISPQWNSSKVDLSTFFGKVLRMFSTDSVFEFGFDTDMRNNAENILSVDQGTLGMGGGTRDFYLDEKQYAPIVAAYKSFAKNIAQILVSDANVSISNDQINSDVDKMFAFEQKLAKIQTPEENRRNMSDLYNKRNFEYLDQILDSVNMKVLMQNAVPKQVYDLVTSGQYQIIISAMDYLQKLNDLLKTENKRNVVNFVLWKVIKTFIQTLDDRFQAQNQAFNSVYLGTATDTPLWKKCATTAMQDMDMAVGAVYVRKYFTNKDKAEATDMITKIKSAFRNIVSNGTIWMDDATKSAALEKLDSMRDNVGYPDMAIDDKKLDEYYANLTTDGLNKSSTYFSLYKRLASYLVSREAYKLLKLSDRFQFPLSPAMADASYGIDRNVITIPAAILQPPSFAKDFPKFVNYGCIGSVIGHEITHGFDDQGSQYDKNGTLKNWWSAPSAKKFTVNKECMIKQYDHYVVPEINRKMNGKTTIGENIADNGGVKESFKAYQDYLQTIGGFEPSLPGLQNMTNNQLFFVSYANFWCESIRPSAVQQQVLTNEHSPSRFRVNGVVANSRDFAKAFSCPPGSPMNPRNKCSVW